MQTSATSRIIGRSSFLDINNRDSNILTVRFLALSASGSLKHYLTTQRSQASIINSLAFWKHFQTNWHVARETN